ncbi:hypothetical protein ACVINZ_000953 [Mesorhizobium jarvisii]
MVNLDHRLLVIFVQRYVKPFGGQPVKFFVASIASM